MELVRASHTEIKKVIDIYQRPENFNPQKGDVFLASSGAAIYYRGGGWWIISGYAYDMRDEKQVIEKINH